MTNQIKHIDDVEEQIDFDKVFNALTISRPILFSTPMVQAIDAKRKTQTRRTRGLEQINKNPDDWTLKTLTGNSEWILNTKTHNFEEISLKCPYGSPGDLLWVRETFIHVMHDHANDLLEGRTENSQYVYKNSFHEDWFEYAKSKYGYKWKPSIHMPKEAARLWLQIKSIGLERLQIISENDCIAEGIEKQVEGYKNYLVNMPPGFCWPTPYNSFLSLWESVNGEGSWEVNPWVWVIEFSVVSKTNL